MMYTIYNLIYCSCSVGDVNCSAAVFCELESKNVARAWGHKIAYCGFSENAPPVNPL